MTSQVAQVNDVRVSATSAMEAPALPLPEILPSYDGAAGGGVSGAEALTPPTEATAYDEQGGEGDDDKFEEAEENGTFGIASIVITETKLAKDSRGKKYNVFTTQVTMVSGLVWTVDRRYSEFNNLNKDLGRQFGSVRALTFPPKTWFSRLATKTVEHRRTELNRYLSDVIQLQLRPRELNEFLELSDHVHADGEEGGSASARKLAVTDFELLKVLGKGSFGKVFLVRHLHNDEVYAMKVLKKEEVRRRKQVGHTRAERRIMGSISHPFVVKLRFAFQSRDKLYMVSDYYRGGELFYHLKRTRTLSEERGRFYTAELTSALGFLHSQGVIYRDLKPENILLDDDGHIGITDFGLSKDDVKKEEAKTFCGTPEYLAPEMILSRNTSEGYGVNVDWWSMGTLLYEMLTGWPPFYDKNIQKMCKKILSAPLAFPFSVPLSDEAKSLISGLLQVRVSVSSSFFSTESRTACAQSFRQSQRRSPLLPHRRARCALLTASSFPAFSPPSFLRTAQRDPTRRSSLEDIKAHPWFASIDWDALDRRELTPPFKPNITGTTDIRYFETEFTREQPRLTPDEDDVEGIAAAAAHAEGEGFDGFTFVDQDSALTADADPAFETRDASESADGVVVTGGW